jgi:hypothetical protein
MATLTRSEIKESLLRVRDTGSVNMWDVRGVAFVAEGLGDFAVAQWLKIKSNHDAYARWLGKTDDEALPEEVTL